MPYTTRSKKAKKNKASWKEPKPYQLMDPAAVSDPSYIDYPSTPSSSSANCSTTFSDPTRSLSDSRDYELKGKKVPGKKSKAAGNGQLNADALLALLNSQPPATVEMDQGKSAPEKKGKKMESKAAAGPSERKREKKMESEAAAASSPQLMKKQAVIAPQNNKNAPPKKRKTMETSPAPASAAGLDQRKRNKLHGFFGMKLKQIVKEKRFLQECKEMLEKGAPPFDAAADSMGRLFGKEMKLAMAQFHYDDGRDDK